jgi:hypothetical protein
VQLSVLASLYGVALLRPDVLGSEPEEVMMLAVQALVAYLLLAHLRLAFSPPR